MALMFGDHGDEYGDSRVYQQLARLPDRFVIFAQPAVHSPGGSRYPDYVILDKKRGVLVVEVKDWKYVQPAWGEKAEILKSQGWESLMLTNPIEQARQASITLRKAFQEDPSLVHHRGPYRGKTIISVGYIGFLPNQVESNIKKLRKCWGYGSLLGKEELESLELLEARLDRYPYKFAQNLDFPGKVFNRIHHILRPEILVWDEMLTPR